jgi:hypothetical protein
MLFTAPISLHGYNFTIEHALNKSMKFLKIFEHLRFMTEEIKSRKFAIIINETNIIVLIAKGINGRTPHIRKKQDLKVQ